jgi:rhamnose utilization protein RhaD (predicted bifunctional aldolase and dehydrogenase)
VKTDQSLLEAALAGYQAQITRIQQAMQDIRQRLGQKAANTAKPAAGPARRKMSAAARKRIAKAQRKRWAEYKKQQAAGK